MAEAKAPDTKAVDPRVKEAQDALDREQKAAQAERDDHLRQIEARADEDSKGEEGPGMWVQYVNPNREDPDFVSMDGYTFERGGDAIMVKVEPTRAAKFQGNHHFRVLEVLKDASGVEDGATKSAPALDSRPRSKPKVGKTG